MKKLISRITRSNTARLATTLFQNRPGIFIGSIIAFFLVAVKPFFASYMTGRMIDELVANPKSHAWLWLLIVGYIVAVAGPALMYQIQNYFLKMLWLILGQHLDIAIVRKKGEMDVQTLENPANNDLFNRVQENAAIKTKMYMERALFLLQNGTEVLLAAAAILVLKWWILLVVLASTVPQLFVEVKFGNQTWGIWSWHAEKRRKFYDLQSNFQKIPPVIELKLFQNVKTFVGKMTHLFDEFRSDQEKNEHRKLVYEVASCLLAQAFYGGATIYFVHEVMAGNMTIGKMLFALACVTDLRNSLAGCFYNIGRQYEDGLFVRDLYKYLDIPPALESLGNFALEPKKTPSILFDRVSFKYPGTDRYVLKDFTLKVTPGEKLALVGINGAGKTTLIKLLCRFYDPTEGCIYIDGVDLKKINLDSWYAQLGALFQEYSQYHFPVGESVMLGRSERLGDMNSEEDACKALEKAQAIDFVDAWPNKKSQMLGKQFEGGVEPSVGQWQKLALARLFFREANVMILDEPTSAIDAEAEANIFEIIRNMPDNQTILFISHRFSTVRMADRIALIEDGKVSEIGTHEKLLESHGGYARLFELQAKGYN